MESTISQNTEFVKSLARELGFSFCGISKAEFLEEEAPRLESWLKRGYQGKMSYLENHFDKRLNPALLVPGAKKRGLIDNKTCSIDELRSAIMPGYDIASDRWLFQHLTQTLDLRMLQLLMKNDDRVIASGFSVNLNVATLLSDRFLAFDANLRSATRGTVIFELQTIDIFSDLGAYLFARDFVKERGYRVCLDGVTDLTLPFIDRERLGLDLIKVVWNPDMLGSGREAKRDEFRKLIASFGRARTILCRCDSEEAVATGQSLGISLFQGRYIDRLLGAGATSVAELQKLRDAAATKLRR